MQNLLLRFFFLFHFSIFAFFQTSVQWLVARKAVTGTFPPCFERKRIGWNKTLLSIWSTWNTALKRYRLFYFSETRGKTHEQIAMLMPNHLLIHIRKVFSSAFPTPLVGKSKRMHALCALVASYQQQMLLVTHLRKPRFYT